ncbi:MAG TPA: hypothetical protein VGP55_12895 [Chitinophagaceae bacterium]|nr:hypothetical protein [Chitinophagaceae bacterium]
MKINWFTVIAQVINFLILVWLLKRFLYKPILKAVDEREKKITSQLKDAKAEKAEAKKEQDEFAKKNDDFDQQKKALMDKAVADTNDEKNKLLEAARKEANDLQVKLEKAAKDVQEKMKERLVQKVQDEVFAISRKTLTDLASVSLEEQSANLFIKRLDELKDNEKKQFIDAFKADAKPVLIRSAFELPAKQQTEIKKSVHDILGAKTHYEFAVAPEIISGIELSANGYKLSWSISEYLTSLEKSIGETIEENTKTETVKKPEPEAKAATENKSNSETNPEPNVKAEPKKEAIAEKK